MDAAPLIVPPPNVRSLLEKAAARVGKRPALESKILEKHGSDPRFAFLKPADPYHAYYQEEVKKSRQALAAEALSEPSNPVPAEASQDPAGQLAKQASEAVVNAEEESPAPQQEARAVVSRLKAAKLQASRDRKPPDHAPPDDKFTVYGTEAVPDFLSLEVIKLVAQFAAQYGPDFLSQIYAKEERNPLFDFLKPVHPHSALLDGYTKAYREALSNLAGAKQAAAHWANAESSEPVTLSKMWHRSDWSRAKSRNRSDDRVDDAPLSSSAIVDWHDFVVVETVEFDDSDTSLPAPLSDPAQIPRIMAAADKARRELENNLKNVDMDMDVDADEAMGAVAGERPPAGVNMVGTVETADVDADIPAHRVRRTISDDDAVHRTGGGKSIPGANNNSTDSVHGRARQDMDHRVHDVRLPDGQVVPLSEATPAMRAQLIDPKYKEERIRAAEKNQRHNLADGEAMALHLARLNRDKPDSGVYNRGDLQGSLLGRTHTPSSSVQQPAPALSGPRLPDPAAAGGAKGSPGLPLNRARIEAAVGALKNATGSRPVDSLSTARAQGADVASTPVLSSTDPPSGRLSEDDWISKVGDKVEVCVCVPVHPNQDWKLSGQTINMEVPLKSTVQRLKEVVSKCTKVPANKQKLLYGDAGFMTNRQSLAFYNVAAKSKIVLEVKERGGKRKAGS